MKKNKLLFIAFLFGMATVSISEAADLIQDDRWYVAPFGSYVNTGGDRQSSDAWGGGLGIGKMIDKHFNAELKGFYQGGFAGQSSPLNMSGGTADVQYYFSRDTFAPYAVLGAGGMDTCVAAKCAAGIIAETGLGFTYELNDNFLFRSDVRYRYNNNFNTSLQTGITEFNDMVVNMGFVIPFGDKPKSTALKIEQPVTPAPVSRADCSTLDSDHDGVNDCLDKCPDTYKGSKVDKFGCPVKLILKGQHFKLDSAQLTPEAKTILDEVAANLKAYPEKNDIEVQGHASSEGGAMHNMKLSQNRAKSVVDYLKSKGVSNRLTAKGFGITKPVADNATEAGRSENRRVELIWIQD